MPSAKHNTCNITEMPTSSQFCARFIPIIYLFTQQHFNFIPAYNQVNFDDVSGERNYVYSHNCSCEWQAKQPARVKSATSCKTVLGAFLIKSLSHSLYVNTKEHVLWFSHGDLQYKLLYWKVIFKNV